MVIAGTHQRPVNHHRNVITTTIQAPVTTAAAVAAAAAAANHHQHQQQQQQQQQHHQLQQHNHANTPNNGNTIIATATAAAPSNAIEHFNVTSIGELSNVQLSSINAQLVGGTVTADGNLVTMGGVVIGRIHPASLQSNGHTLQPQLRTTAQPATREELQQLGVIKVESPAAEFQNEG
ncbi:ecdysone-induced protein 78C-like [Anastrepha obliqua]|uniref:ecdysone-induced protein 78C-like n=1 Tax=Anastrepha ludens TaxID=28586 RepID=UPI0023AF0726|nr:ecdysone-induced protein 78C-like [Anastrepha ludens]XP_054732661.1 ecdysone-induced protein 78C-like [Anastrepha obliqua]